MSIWSSFDAAASSFLALFDANTDLDADAADADDADAVTDPDAAPTALSPPLIPTVLSPPAIPGPFFALLLIVVVGLLFDPSSLDAAGTVPSHPRTEEENDAADK